MGSAVDVLDAFGGLEPRDASGGEPASALLEVERGVTDDEHAHALAEAVVGNADRHGLAYRRVRGHDLLDLGRGDVLAPADDDVLLAADDREPAVVEGGEVAGVEPAARDRGARLRGVEVAGEELRALHEQLAVARDAELGRAHHVAVRVRGPFEGVGHTRRRDRRCLRRTVRPLDHRTERVGGGLDERRGHAGAARRHEPKRRDAFGGEAGRAHEADEEGGRSDHEAHALVGDGRERTFGIPSFHEHHPHARGAGDEDAVEQPGDVGERRGHQHHVVVTQSVRLHHRARLVREATVRVENSLGAAFGATGPDDDRDVGGSGVARAVAAVGRELGHAAAELVGGEEQRGAQSREQLLDLRGPGEVVDRRRHRAQLPTRAVEVGDLGPVRRLPRDHVAVSDAGGAQSGRERRCVADDVGERGDVPGATGAPVVGAAGVRVGGAHDQRPDPAELDASRVSGPAGSTRARSGPRHGAGSCR